MKKYIPILINVIRILIFIYIAWFIVYVLIWGEIKSRKSTKVFCKQQCIYSPENKEWRLDVQSHFDEDGVSSKMETKKSFSEKDLDECVNYCIDLGDHLRSLNSRDY